MVNFVVIGPFDIPVIKGVNPPEVAKAFQQIAQLPERGLTDPIGRLNARVYTLNPQQPWAEAVAISGDKIVAVGSAHDVAPYRGSSTKVIDAGKRLVLPGFVDCHIHFMDGSLGLTQVDLNGAKTVAEIQKRVKVYAAAHPRENVG